jgi:hypothetical protein
MLSDGRRSSAWVCRRLLRRPEATAVNGSSATDNSGHFGRREEQLRKLGQLAEAAGLEEEYRTIYLKAQGDRGSP